MTETMAPRAVGVRPEVGRRIWRGREVFSNHMTNLIKLLAVLAGVIAVARVATAPKVCFCAGPLCACNYRR